MARRRPRASDGKPRWLRPLAVATVYLPSWYALDALGQQFSVAPAVSVWRPAFPLGLVLMLVFGLRYAPLLLFASRVFGLVDDLSLPLVVIYDVATVLPMAAGCWLLLRRLRINPRLRDLRDVAWFVGVAAVAVPLVVAVAQVGILAAAGIVPWAEAFQRTLHNWAGDATGTGMVAPPLLLLLRRRPDLWAAPEPDPPRSIPWRLPSRRQLAIGAAESGALVLAIWAAYGTSNDGSLDYTYVLFVPLLAIAVHHGFEATVLAVLVLNVGTALLVAIREVAADDFALQFGLMTLTLTALLMGAFISDRRRYRKELEASYDASIEGWSRALDLRDGETSDHTRRVTEWTVRLAAACGINGETLVDVRRGALLHDIGKMGVPDAVLRKPGSLTEEEWGVMRRHPMFAADLLGSAEHLKRVLDIPICHHERWDGRGYPRGLRHEEIPLAARLFAVVDVWDALSSDRPYRPGWPREEVLAYLRSHAGTQFDPKAVAAFLALLARTEPGAGGSD